HYRDRLFGHLALTTVGEQTLRLLERQPARFVHLVRRLRRQIAEPAARVAEQIKGHELEDPLAVPRVDVAHVAELLDQPRLHAGLLGHLPQRGRVGLLAGPDVPLRQRPEPGLLPRRTYRSHHPRAPQPTNDDGTSRELPAHKPFLTDGCSPGLEALHS